MTGYVLFINGGRFMLSGADIVCFSSIDWDFVWQGHQEIMSTLAAHGNRVLFVENTGVRTPTLKDLPRLRQRLRNWRGGTKGFRQVRENLVVYAPVILPFPYSRLARWLNRLLVVRALRRWMRVTGFGRPIAWSFLPTPLVRDLIRALNPQVTVYYCIDDFAASSSQAKKIRCSETAFFREADLVFVTSEKLRQRAAGLNHHVHLFPFGVNFEQFERARLSHDEIPSELRALPRPIVGYLGGIHQWVDQELLIHAAQQVPEASFVLVGPSQTDVSRLARCPNVHLLGSRSHADVPRYLRGFDAGIVPYRRSDYTDHVYPTKLNEYLAMGLPVVATDLPEIRRFNMEHGDVVAMTSGADAFVSAVRQAVGAACSSADVARRIEIAQLNSWKARIIRMSGMIEEQLGTRQASVKGWEEPLRRLYRTAHHRLIRAGVGLVAVYLALFYTPLVWIAAEPLRTADQPHTADAIVAFAGGVGESGRAGQGYEERVAWAVDLYRRGYAHKMVFSSGYSYTFREPEVMRALAISLGVPSQDIITEERAVTTYQNVVHTARLLDQHGWNDVLLVSSPYHMRRAALVWRRVAPQKRVWCVPIPDSLFYRHGRSADGRPILRQASLEQLRAILHEYLGIVYYRLRGYL